MAEHMLRVLHVFGRMTRGGAELRTVELAESFGRERVQSDFLVLTGLEGPLDARVRAAGGEVFKCRLDGRFPGRFYRLLRARRYDIVHSHVHYFSGVILALARAAGTPGRVAHFRSAVVNDKADTPWRRLQLSTCRRLVHLAATDILAVGEGTMQAAWSAEWKSDPRCRVVHNGIHPERLRHLRRRTPDAPTIINVASVQPLKNQGRLIGVLRRCLRQVPTLRLVLAGREVGDYGARVRRAAADAGLSDRVQLLGELEDPIPWIARADLMILPSLWEGLPGAALEACALGVPVLAADLPGTRELAEHFPHMVVLPLSEDDEAWATTAVRLMQEGADVATAAELFANSPFTIARAREAHYDIWSRSRATA